ncbi:MAG: nitroreductase family protein [Clostridia bacterium]|nr:nitroreductase family protein [Clostridia bacterium]
MDFYEAVNNRRSIRNFTDEKIPEETIKRIVEAAYKAPANDHFRDWHYIVITDKDKMREVIDGVPKNLTEKDVDNMTFISDPEQKRAYQIAVPMQYRMLIDAAAIIIPLMKKKCDILHPSSLSDLNCYASVWCSIENLWLAAVAEGYACNLRIPLGDEESIARKVLGFPENYMIPCFIGVGKATEDAVKTKQIDINIDELLHWEKF